MKREPAEKYSLFPYEIFEIPFFILFKPSTRIFNRQSNTKFKEEENWKIEKKNIHIYVFRCVYKKYNQIHIDNIVYVWGPLKCNAFRYLQ